MKRLLAIPLVVLGMASAARAQDQVSVSPDAGARLSQSGDWILAAPQTSLDALSFSMPNPSPALSPAPSTSASFAAPPAPASPQPPPAAPSPSFNYSDREYRWEMSLGFELVRFRSSVYYATAAGLHSSVGYFVNDWIVLEGDVNTAFAPEIYTQEHIKYLGYGAGPRVVGGRYARFEPWAHILVGGVHILPLTGLGGKNAFEITAGGGADYVFNPRISARIELDYLRTTLFGASQNSAQGSLGAVFHF